MYLPPSAMSTDDVRQIIVSLVMREMADDRIHVTCHAPGMASNYPDSWAITAVGEPYSLAMFISHTEVVWQILATRRLFNVKGMLLVEATTCELADPACIQMIMSAIDEVRKAQGVEAFFRYSDYKAMRKGT